MIIDINDYKKAEGALSLSEKTFAMAFRFSPALMAIVTLPQGKYVEVNDTFLRITGFTREEIIGRTSTELGIWNSKRDLAEFVSILREQGSVSNFELSFKGKSGQMRDFLVSAEPMIIGDQRHLLVVANDVTKIIRGREELLLSYRRLLDVIEFLPDATFVVDHERNVVAWNRKLEELTGIRKREIVGKGEQCYSLPFYGRHRPILIDYAMTTDNLLGGEHGYSFFAKKDNVLLAESFLTALHRGKGKIMWAAACPLYDCNGNIVGGIETIRNLAELKDAITGEDCKAWSWTIRNLSELKEKEKGDPNYRTLFETTGDALILLDEMSILDCNSAAVRMFKCSDRADLLRKRPFELSSNITGGKARLPSQIMLLLKYSFRQ